MRPSRPLRLLGVLLLVPAVAFTAFFFWASAPVLSPDAYHQVHGYGAPPRAPSDTLTVVTYNLGYLSGRTNNRPLDPDAAFFDRNVDAAHALLAAADADVVAFQEIDFGAARSYDVDQLDELARRGGYHMAAAAVNWDERYVPFPYGLPHVHFGRVLSGQAVLSRLPLGEQHVEVLERPPNPFYYDAFYIDRLAQVVEMTGARPFVLINVHLEAFHAATRVRQAEVLRALYETYAAEQPVLVVGDFNSLLPADAPAGSDDARAMAALLEAPHLKAAYTTLHGPALPADGTYPADAPRYKIDHVLYDDRWFEPVEVEVLGGLDDPPSDHRAVRVRLRWLQ